MKTLRMTITLSIISIFGLSACATDEYGNKRPLTDAETGALIGAASGAVLGGAVSKNNRTKGVLIGAVGGASPRPASRGSSASRTSTSPRHHRSLRGRSPRSPPAPG